MELHVHQKDWQAHGHSRDPRYNSVALHAVYAADASFTTLPNGVRAPHGLAEAPAGGGGVSSDGWLPLGSHLGALGFPRPETPDQLASTLDQGGDARFLEKSRAFEALMDEEPPEEVLYAAIMEGLGYSQNRAPFQELAHRLPYHVPERSCP